MVFDDSPDSALRNKTEQDSSHLFLSGKSFSRELAAEAAKQLPKFDLQQSINVHGAHPALHTYFSTYGFDALLSVVGDCRYSVGHLHTQSYRLAVHAWQRNQATATVLVSHGLFDHVGLYLGVIEQLLNAGYSVVALDFPGHGLSEGEPAVIHDFSTYASVIEESLQAVMRDMPSALFAIGQSTGGAALLNYVLREKSTPAIDRLVLLAPLIQPHKWPLINLSYLLLNKFVKFVPRNFTINSHREGFCEFLRDYDPLQPRHISTEWTGAMRQWIKKFDRLPESNTPCLVIQGDADMTVDWEKNLPRIQRKFSNIEIKMIEGGMHHLVCEGDAWRSQVYRYMLDFLSAPDPNQN